jgi:hypothetical protein
MIQTVLTGATRSAFAPIPGTWMSTTYLTPWGGLSRMSLTAVSKGCRID